MYFHGMKLHFILLVVSVLLLACTRELVPLKVLSQPWALEKMTKNGEEIPAAILGNPVYDFEPDGRYKTTIGHLVDNGKWQLRADTITTFLKEGKQINHYQVIEMGKDRAVLKNLSTDNPVLFVLVPLDKANQVKYVDND